METPSLIYCNNYAPEIEVQLGFQPVRVLYRYTSNILVNISIEIEKEYPHCKETQIIYNSDYSRATSPDVLFGTVRISESFLSFLWCSCYGILITAPIRDVPSEERIEGHNLIRYALSLLENYSQWDLASPNPECFHKNRVEQVGKANAAYIIAVNFIAYHEFAHLIFNDKESNKENEIRADLFATERVMKFAKEDNDDETTIVLGILSALGAILITSKSLKAYTHPDPDHRISTILDHLGYPEDHFSWAYATILIMNWSIIHKIKISYPERYINFKDYYLRLIAAISTWKNSEN